MPKLHYPVIKKKSSLMMIKNLKLTTRQNRKQLFNLVQVPLPDISIRMILDLELAMDQSQMDKFIFLNKNSVMSRNKRPFSLVAISKVLSVWLIQLLQRRMWNQFSMKWWTKNYWKITFSLSTWPQSKLKEQVLNQTWLSAIMIKRSLREIWTGMMLNTNICMVLNLMIFYSMVNQQMYVKTDQKINLASLPLILVHPSCQYQNSLPKISSSMVFQLLNSLRDARVLRNLVTCPLLLVENNIH